MVPFTSPFREEMEIDLNLRAISAEETEVSSGGAKPLLMHGLQARSDALSEET